LRRTSRGFILRHAGLPIPDFVQAVGNPAVHAARRLKDSALSAHSSRPMLRSRRMPPMSGRCSGLSRQNSTAKRAVLTLQEEHIPSLCQQTDERASHLGSGLDPLQCRLKQPQPTLPRRLELFPSLDLGRTVTTAQPATVAHCSPIAVNGPTQPAGQATHRLTVFWAITRSSGSLRKPKLRASPGTSFACERAALL
jgi:hypothetical protein